MTSYIEKDFPIGFLSQLAEQESWRKEVYRPVYYIHKWWAKRLGSVFRGIILAACAKEESNIQGNFYKSTNFSNITIFDPFMGSGSALVEGALHQSINKLYGLDINPLAIFVAKTKTFPIKPEKLESEFVKLLEKLDNKKNVDLGFYNLSNIDYWFKKQVIGDLSKLKSTIDEITNKNSRNFIFIFF